MKAYPYMHKHPTSGQTTISDGMDLRDYFAAKAMQGFMANKSNPMHFQPEADASWAYSIADAMLKQRNYKEVPNEHHPAE
jgi:hypothetical protein